MAWEAMKYGHLRTNKTWDETLLDIRDELGKWGIQKWEEPSWRRANANGGKVTVRFEAPNGRGWQEVTCASWREPRINLRAIYMAVEAVRLMDQRGIGQVLAQVSAHLALPPPKGVKSPQEILGIQPGMTAKQQVDLARQRMISAHPDHGGTAEQFRQVREAAEKLGLV